MRKSILVSLVAFATATVPSLATAQVCPVSNGIAICPVEQESEQANGLVVALGAAVLVWGLYTVYKNNSGDKAAIASTSFDISSGISHRINKNLTFNYFSVDKIEPNTDYYGFKQSQLFKETDYRIGVVGASYKF